MSEHTSLPRFCGEGYVARLQRHGFEVIGTGGGYSFPATFVLSRRESDAVIKVGAFPAGDPWPIYAEWCIANPGPLQPVVRSLRWHGRRGDRFFVATMDKLREIDWRAHQALIWALHDWYEMLRSEGIDYRDWHDGPIDKRLVAWLSNGLETAGLVQVSDYFRRLVMMFPALRLDPQPCNWMLAADGKLVMIDPFARTKAEVAETTSMRLRLQT